MAVPCSLAQFESMNPVWLLAAVQAQFGLPYRYEVPSFMGLYSGLLGVLVSSLALCSNCWLCDAQLSQGKLFWVNTQCDGSTSCKELRIQYQHLRSRRVQFSNTSLFRLVALCFIELLWRIRKARVVRVSFGMNCMTVHVNFDMGSKKKLSVCAKPRKGFVTQVSARGAWVIKGAGRARGNSEIDCGRVTSINEAQWV